MIKQVTELISEGLPEKPFQKLFSLNGFNPGIVFLLRCTFHSAVGGQLVLLLARPTSYGIVIPVLRRVLTNFVTFCCHSSITIQICIHVLSSHGQLASAGPKLKSTSSTTQTAK